MGGVAYSGFLVALAILVNHSVTQSEELLTFGIWYIFSVVMLIILRLVGTYIIIPGAKLSEEIARDRNWGAAAVFASLEIALALGLRSFLPDECIDVSVIA